MEFIFEKENGTVCPRSLAPFYKVTYNNKMSQDFLDKQYFTYL